MQYRKKPVVVEAIQLQLLNFNQVEEFVGGDIGKNQKGETVIATLEGPIICSINDWIIKGYTKERGYHFWVNKPDYFKEAYEEVLDESESPSDTEDEDESDSLLDLLYEHTLSKESTAQFIERMKQRYTIKRR